MSKTTTKRTPRAGAKREARKSTTAGERSDLRKKVAGLREIFASVERTLFLAGVPVSDTRGPLLLVERVQLLVADRDRLAESATALDATCARLRAELVEREAECGELRRGAAHLAEVERLTAGQLAGAHALLARAQRELRRRGLVERSEGYALDAAIAAAVGDGGEGR